MPSVVKVGQRLAVLYDGPGANSQSHMRRDIGLAWLKLPLVPPTKLNEIRETGDFVLSVLAKVPLLRPALVLPVRLADLDHLTVPAGDQNAPNDQWAYGGGDSYNCVTICKF
jgi:hypothetical protein